MKKENIKLTLEQFNKYVDQAVKDFNFTRVYEFMKLVDWAWHSTIEHGYIPSPSALEASVRGLFDCMWKEDITNIATGGFQCGIEDESLFYIQFTCEEVTVDIEE